ncbi:hypothetical protein WR25_08832 [Diploscapter pachys]|uniref:SXP/RAL-2 family protein Ani s 5-like cation-binding domain-containing protein n=1 Tax=Diploscapter pachys TaxID=2018661 RepID=A0A2A2JB26_9BILA|nr:hypothetical protein WR25_08832 [Diploscapter pachys]
MSFPLLLLTSVIPPSLGYLPFSFHNIPAAPPAINIPSPYMQQIPSHYIQQIPIPYNQIYGGSPSPSYPYPQPAPQGKPCPLTPFATFLTEEQQETLHELVTEARRTGADEPTVKQHIYRYLTEILSPQRFAEFQDAEAEFEMQRRGKRNSIEGEKPLPVKVYDLVDQYINSDNGYATLYEESSKKNIRERPHNIMI